MKTYGLFFFAVMVLVVIGCDAQKSSETESDHIAAYYSVDTDKDSTLFSAKFYDAQSSHLDEYIALHDGDYIYAVLPGKKVELTRSLTAYDARVYGDLSGQDVRFDLERSAERRSAPSSIVTIPTISIISPAPGSIISLSHDNFIISWVPEVVSGTSSGVDSMKYEIGVPGICSQYIVGGEINNLSDTGTWTIPAGVLSRPTLSQTCEAVFTLTRARKGTLDPALAGTGSIEVTNKRVISIFLSP